MDESIDTRAMGDASRTSAWACGEPRLAAAVTMPHLGRIFHNAHQIPTPRSRRHKEAVWGSSTTPRRTFEGLEHHGGGVASSADSRSCAVANSDGIQVWEFKRGGNSSISKISAIPRVAWPSVRTASVSPPMKKLAHLFYAWSRMHYLSPADLKE